MNRRWIVASCVTLALLTALCLGMRQHAIAFQSLDQAKARLLAAGFQCSSDSSHGNTTTGFMISRESISAEEICGICKAGDLGPQWKGRVWVTLNPDSWQIHSIPDHADTRVWGSVIAFGDGAFLTEVDDVLSHQGE